MPRRHTAEATRSTKQSLLAGFGVVALVAVGLIVGFAGTGGTYAAWNSSSSVSGATITTGSTSIQVSTIAGTQFTASLTLPALSTNLAPGDTVAAGFTVKSTGTTAVQLGATVSQTASGAASVALASALKVNVVAVTGTSCSGQTAATAALSSYAPTNLASLNASGSPTNTSKTFCVVLTLPSTAPATAQGGTVPFTLNLTGTQVRS